MVTRISPKTFSLATTDVLANLDISIINPVPSHLLPDIPNHNPRFQLKRPFITQNPTPLGQNLGETNNDDGKPCVGLT